MAKIDVLGYIFEKEDVEALKQINKVLFSDTKLTDDLRRDLANKMQVHMWRAEEITEEDAEKMNLNVPKKETPNG